MLGKMAHYVEMMQKYCVSFLPCLVAFWGFHSYMHMFIFENIFALVVLPFHAVIFVSLDHLKLLKTCSAQAGSCQENELE